MKKRYLVLVAIVSMLLTSITMNHKVSTYKDIAQETTKKNKKVTKSNKKMKHDIRILQETNTDLYDQINSKNNSAKSSNSINDDKLRLFMNTVLNYTNKNYVSRFNEAKKYAGDQPISLFEITRDNLETPKVTVSSKITDYKFYPEPNSSTQGIAVVKVDFNYQGRVQHIIYEYDVELAKDGTVENLTQRIIQNDKN